MGTKQDTQTNTVVKKLAAFLFCFYSTYYLVRARHGLRLEIWTSYIAQLFALHAVQYDNGYWLALLVLSFFVIHSWTFSTFMHLLSCFIPFDIKFCEVFARFNLSQRKHMNFVPKVCEVCRADHWVQQDACMHACNEVLICMAAHTTVGLIEENVFSVAG